MLSRAWKVSLLYLRRLLGKSLLECGEGKVGTPTKRRVRGFLFAEIAWATPFFTPGPRPRHPSFRQGNNNLFRGARTWSSRPTFGPEVGGDFSLEDRRSDRVAEPCAGVTAGRGSFTRAADETPRCPGALGGNSPGARALVAIKKSTRDPSKDGITLPV